MWNENRLTELLNIKYPIIQAGMAGGVTTPELVAAVSNSGALGTIGAGYLSPDKTRAIITQVKALTDKPFAVNLFVPEPLNVDKTQIDKSKAALHPMYKELGIDNLPEIDVENLNMFDEQIKVIIDMKVPICSFTFGVPHMDVMKQLKSHGIKTIGTATTVSEAQINAEKGMDAVVMQGSEAGGHRGSFDDGFHEAMIGTMALVPQAADAVDIPVIAAGGINDGRGVIASLILGAAGGQIGTAFLTTFESGTNVNHQSSILNSVETDTIMTSAFSGKPARGIRNNFTDKMTGMEDSFAPYPIQHMLTSIIRLEAGVQNNPELMALWSGQNIRSNKKQSAQCLIEAIVSDAERIRADLK